MFPEASPGSGTFCAGQKGQIRCTRDARRADRPILCCVRALYATELEFWGGQVNQEVRAPSVEMPRNRNTILVVTQPFFIVGDKVMLGQNLSLAPNDGALDRTVVLIPSQSLDPNTKREFDNLRVNLDNAMKSRLEKCAYVPVGNPS